MKVFFARSDCLLKLGISNAIHLGAAQNRLGKMASQFSAVTNEEMSQIIEEAAPEIHDEKATKFGLEA